MPERRNYLISWFPAGGENQEELTAFVTSIEFRYGMAGPYEEFAQPARAIITCANDTGVFNPDASNTFSGMGRGDRITISMSVGGMLPAYSQIFEAKIAQRDFQKDYVTITVEDQMLRLLAHEIKPKLLQNVRVDEAILSAFEQQIALWPYDYFFFTLGYSVLGNYSGWPIPRDYENRLWGTPNVSLQEAKTTLTWAGDISQAGTNAQQYLRDLVAAEGGGRFFWDAVSGQFKFQNRWNDSVNYSQLASLDGDDIVSASFVMDADVVNHAKVNYRPRSASNSVTVLYESPNAITLKTSTTLNITANYQDPANPGAQCAALDAVCIIGTDIIINTQQDGSGTNVTAQQTVLITFNATSATFEITNNTSDTLYITELQVRGKPISLLDVETVEYTNIESVRQYDRQEVILNIPALDNADIAQSIARLTVLPRREPVRRFRSVTFIANTNSTLMGYARNRRIGDGVNVTYDGSDRDYVIVGQQHRIIPGGSNGHEVTWILKDVTTGAFFTIGKSKLGSAELLAF